LRNSKILEIALEKGEKEKKKITILLSTTWKQPQMEVHNPEHLNNEYRGVEA
jgi:Txe/YoeB family toxin of Txe-Axe toxin-antitoxin module